ncbi:unnamed protein product [Camellia sinensis]
MSPTYITLNTKHSSLSLLTLSLSLSLSGFIATMAKPYFLLSLILLNFSLLKASNPDIEPLMEFKAASDPSNKLNTWNQSTDPCSWYGVSCQQNRVSRLVLEGLDLHGTFQPLTSLTQLRVLSLKRNNLSGPISNLSNLTALKLLFLSYNQFSGKFPDSGTSLFRLYRLDLSHNNFSGQIPANVNRLIHLLTLRLEENQFSGPISQIDLPNLQDFNVSGDTLSGEIPKSFSGFPKSAFSINPVLCGSPLPSCKTNNESFSSDPTRPGPSGAIASPLSPVVSSSPSSIPVITTPNKSGNPRHSGVGKVTPVMIIAIIIGDVLVLAVVSVRPLLLLRQIPKRKRVPSSPYPHTTTQPGFERGRMVFFEGAKRFELEDLLRASAEMLGKGGFGTAYKAVLDDGNVVAVKRLKEASIGGRREFEQQMEVLGRLRHQNVVGLKSYYFARDEKLLVYDYMPNGNLFWLLHGNRGLGSGWSLRLTHGNIKSTNILLDKVGNARVSDFGLSVFVPPTASLSRSSSYHAPEALAPRKITQKFDVYSFGVLLLELLTGKYPSLGDNVGSGTEYGGVVGLPR